MWIYVQAIVYFGLDPTKPISCLGPENIAFRSMAFPHAVDADEAYALGHVWSDANPFTGAQPTWVMNDYVIRVGL